MTVQEDYSLLMLNAENKNYILTVHIIRLFFLFQMLLWPAVMIHAECLRISFTYQPIVCPDPLIDGAYSVQEALQTLLRAEATGNPLLSKELRF